jgi:DNA-binding CsgD family transcriptional regulator
MLESPPPLDLPGPEARVVREGCTLVVEQAQDHPYTWKPLMRPAAITSYVSAPIRLGGATVATLHADRWFQRSEVSVEDRDLLGFFANEVSLRLERREEKRRCVAVLTDQQQRVLEGVAAGLSNRQIAAALFVSAETIKSHLANIYRQLEVNNRSEAVGKYFDLEHRIALEPRDG